jgi:hypothetical protein
MKAILKLGLGVLLLSMLTAPAYAWVDAGDNLLVVKTSEKPVIDGQLDNVWKMVGKERMVHYDLTAGTAPTNWLDLFGTVRVMWDDTDLFLFVEINDDVLSVATDNVNNYQYDSVELYFDADNNKTAGMFDGVNDLQIRFNLDQSTADDIDLGYGNGRPDWGFSKEGIVYATFKTTTAITGTMTLGWNLEVQIPLANLGIDPTAGKLFGFDVQINDRDENAQRDHLLRWHSDNDNEWQDASYFGTAKLFNEYVVSGYALPVGKAGFTPVIDGEMESGWTMVPAISDNVFSVGTVKLKASWDDGTVDFRIMWDDERLYLFSQVRDDSIQNTGDYQADGIEYYFDGDNGKTVKGYDGIDDVQFRVKYVFIDPTEINAGGIKPPPNYPRENIQLASLPTETGWNQEISFPLADLNIAAESGTEFGFDIQLNESDAANIRETGSKWWSNSDNSWQDASLFGTAVLKNVQVGTSVDSNEPVGAIPKNCLLTQNYPNPFNPETKIDYQIDSKSLISLKVFDLLGKEVAVLVNGIAAPGMYSVTFNAQNLPSGIYFYKLATNKATITKKMTFIR